MPFEAAAIAQNTPGASLIREAIQEEMGVVLGPPARLGFQQGLARLTAFPGREETIRETALDEKAENDFA
jgi:hypothetical protein